MLWNILATLMEMNHIILSTDEENEVPAKIMCILHSKELSFKGVFGCTVNDFWFCN